MQKLSTSYIFTKFILFSIFELIGACLSALFLYVFNTSTQNAETARALSGAIGLVIWCALTYHMIMTAKLDKIQRSTYILGEGITAFLFLALTGIVCSILGKNSLLTGYKAAVFLPMLPFSYLTGNLYIGLFLQLIFCCFFVTVCYMIKRKKDPFLLGRTKGTEKK